MSISVSAAIVEVYVQTILAQSLTESDASEAVRVSTRFIEFSQAIRASNDLRVRLAESSLPLSVRQGLIDSLFTDQPLGFTAVVKLMVERDELKLLSAVEDRLSSFIEESMGVVIVDVTTVVALDDNLRQTISEKYSAQLNAPVVLREHIDPEIMGGIVMQRGDRRIDASLNAQLIRAQSVLTSDTIGGAD